MNYKHLTEKNKVELSDVYLSFSKLFYCLFIFTLICSIGGEVFYRITVGFNLGPYEINEIDICIFACPLLLLLLRFLFNNLYVRQITKNLKNK